MSCLFDSLSYHVNLELKVNLSAMDIRQLICDYLYDNPELVEGITLSNTIKRNKSVRTYVQEMRRESTWGGANEIKAFVNIFKVKILVYTFNNNQNKPIEFIPNENFRSKHIFKISWNGSHYEPIKNH